MKAIVIGEGHVGELAAFRLKHEGVHALNVSSTEELRTCLVEGDINSNTVILMDTEPIEIKRKPWLDEPMMFTKAPELQYSYSDAYERNSHKHPYKFHK